MLIKDKVKDMSLMINTETENPGFAYDQETRDIVENWKCMYRI
jgi:hypothetical protein